jgi:mono/diheme cytochrome c family protein
MTGPRWVLTLALGSVILGLANGRLVDRVAAQATGGSAVSPGAPTGLAPPHVHGTPKGWRFTLPKGDPAKGREVFQKLECYGCHEVRGERVPPPNDPGRAGPELSMMGPLHSPEFFAESIINPSAVIERNRGYAAADGSSKMPSYAQSLTIQETVDLVGYLRQLRPPAATGPAPTGHGGHAAP